MTTTTPARIALGQIATMDLLATSGGRFRIVDDVTVVLPVAHGYSVEVTYERGIDLYTVRRVFTRGVKRFVKGTRERVYCDELSECVYRAGCYRDEF